MRWMLAASAALLLGCDDGHPLAPDAADATLARGGSPLGAPTLLSVGASWENPSESQLDLAWRDNSTSESTFEIHRSTTGESGTYVVVGGTGVADVVTFADTDVLLGTQYCYRVRAVRVIVSRTTGSALSNAVCATTPSVAPLGTPTGVGAVASEGAVAVTWQDMSSGESGFEVWRHVLLGRTAAGATAFTHAGLDPLTTHCYRIRAFAVAGSDTARSPFSVVACATTPNAVPAPVPYAAAYPGANEVELRWIETAGSTAYGIDRSSDGGATWSRVASVGTYVYGLFHDLGLPAEREVCYRVVASNVLGEAPPSPTACATPGPAAPSAVTIRQVETGVFDLTWTDESALEDAYEVRAPWSWCANDGWGSWYCYEEETVLAVLPANSTSYRLPGWLPVASFSGVNVSAISGGAYSSPAFATYVTSP